MGLKGRNRQCHIVAKFRYDNAGKHQKVVEENSVTHYLYGISGQLLYEARYTTTASDPFGATGAELQQSKEIAYIYAMGQQLAKVDGSFANGAKYYYHNDYLSSTMMMTRFVDVSNVAASDQNKPNPIVFIQDYTPFGQNLHQPGEPVATNETEATLKFTGQIEDADIGLCYYNARYYDPEIGRFTQEDSYPGEPENPLTQNPYIYVLDNPLKYIDPTGHREEEVCVNLDGAGWGINPASVNVPTWKQQELSNLSLNKQLNNGLFTSLNKDFQHKIKKSENNIAGFQFNCYYYFFYGLTLENQIQMYSIMRNVVDDLATDGEITASDKVKINSAKNSLCTVFQQLNSGYKSQNGFYTQEQLDHAIIDIQSIQLAVAELLPTIFESYSVISKFTKIEKVGVNEVTGGIAKNEKIAGSNINHLNGAIAEAHGWEQALARGEIGLQPPGKVTATGPDYITYDPKTQTINVWDSKYSSTGKWPKTAKGFGSQTWLDATQKAINSITNEALKKQVQSAFNKGNINWQIFKWPQ